MEPRHDEGHPAHDLFDSTFATVSVASTCAKLVEVITRCQGNPHLWNKEMADANHRPPRPRWWNSTSREWEYIKLRGHDLYLIDYFDNDMVTAACYTTHWMTGEPTRLMFVFNGVNTDARYRKVVKGIMWAPVLLPTIPDMASPLERPPAPFTEYGHTIKSVRTAIGDHVQCPSGVTP